ncbi:MAG: hypothetical protein WDW38_010008 [Sanguina aurantia]
MSKPAQPSSRLNKLLNLLDVGSDEGTRKAAAQQITDIARNHPEQLPAILRKVHGFLYNPTWETRVAAADALGQLAAVFRHHDAQSLMDAHSRGSSVERASAAGKAQHAAACSAGFKGFNLQHLIEGGTALVASGGQEYDVVEEPGLTPKQRLKLQKKQLKQRLGMEWDVGPKDAEMGADDYIKDEDLEQSQPKPLATSNSTNGGLPAPQRQAAVELLQSMEGLSARERNKLRRQAKAATARGSDRAGSGKVRTPQRMMSLAVSRRVPVPPWLRLGPARASAVVQGQQRGAAAMSAEEASAAGLDEEEWESVVAGAWPFQRVSDQLCLDLLDPVWEVRHGAAVALREILRHQSSAAGVEVDMAAHKQGRASGWALPGGQWWVTRLQQLQNVTWQQVEAAGDANKRWLEDCIVMLVCVLALDRFGDYGSDQAVAPVRETAAQALGVCLSRVDLSTVQAVAHLLRQLQAQQEWHMRHGGYTGLKYLVAARQDLAAELLPACLPSLLTGLQDSDDDVRAASADALVPLAGALTRSGAEVVVSVRLLLWQLLPGLEELSAATLSIMQLLGHLYTAASAADLGPEMTAHVPLLWRFFRLQPPPDGNSLQRYLSLASTPSGQRLDSSSLHHHPPAQEGDAETDPGSTQTTKRSRKDSASQSSAPPSVGPPGSGSSSSGSAAAFVVGSHGADSAVHMRMLTAEAVGSLCHRVQAGASTSSLEAALLASLLHPSATQRCLTALALCSWLKDSTPPPPTPTATTAPHSTAPDTHSSAHDHTHSPQQVAPTPLAFPPALQDALQLHLAAASSSQPSLPDSPRPYSEVAPLHAQMHREVLALVSACLQGGLLLRMPGDTPIDQLLPVHVQALLSSMPAALQAPGPPASAASRGAIERALQRLRAVLSGLMALELYLHGGAMACCAAAVVHSLQLPAKLNSVVQPLMAAVRRQPEEEVQWRHGLCSHPCMVRVQRHHTHAPPLTQAVCATAIAQLIQLCLGRKPSPVDKLLKNLCAMAWGDPRQRRSDHRGRLHCALNDWLNRILLGERERVAHSAWCDPSVPCPVWAAPSPPNSHPKDPAAAAACVVARRGAEAALRATAGLFADTLWTSLPALWELTSAPLTAAAAACSDPTTRGSCLQVPQLQSLVNALAVLRVLGPALAGGVEQSLLPLLPLLLACSRHPSPAVRSAVRGCLCGLLGRWLGALMPEVLRLLVPSLGSTDALERLGAVELVAQLTEVLGSQLVGCVVLLVVPLLQRMSDSHPGVKQVAASCFGKLVALLPLAQGQPSLPGLDTEQLAKVSQDSVFLLQLLDNKKAEDYVLPLQLKVTLRPYQQEGINWLAFLRRFGLHGVLADDMGLGKTLQASAIIGAAAMEQCGLDGTQPALPSLVVCPSTLVAHWAHEVSKFVDPAALRPLQYAGCVAQRMAVQAQLRASQATATPYNLLIVPYETLHSDVHWLASQQWLYMVLDEGHIITNSQAKTTLSVKRVPAKHRLLLSGTPIQNNVMELWSMFDFLMPGFLGPERAFIQQYGKAMQGTRMSKAGSRDAVAGFLAVDALHKSVMPFVLRRTKAQVLQDLPPKIIQDVHCTLSSLQQRLYDDFKLAPGSTVAWLASHAELECVWNLVCRAQASAGLAAFITSGKGRDETAGGDPSPAFAALHYLRKLCSHPKLMLDWQVPHHRQALAEVLHCRDPASAEVQLRSPLHSPKLASLTELMAQCGIIKSTAGDEPGAPDLDDSLGLPSSSRVGHRMLIFAQLDGMLDLVEQHVLQARGVAYLRLDGSVEPSARFALVQRFNTDPTIDILLLSTAVGGLGLNLTGADTVVFMEHDWSPLKDLQAMDRTHRLGQTRTVNVYRLLMKDTLEEQLMGVQQFNLEVATAGANQENMSIAAMDTGAMLDLFGAPGSAQQGQPVGAAGRGGDAVGLDAAGVGKQGMAAAVAGLGEMWDEGQYESQFSHTACAVSAHPVQALRNESPEETRERRLRESLKVEERVYDISTYDDLQKQLGAAESKLVVLEIQCEAVCETGFDEPEPEALWKLDAIKMREMELGRCKQAQSDEGEELCDRLGVEVLPTLQFFRNGVKLYEHRGVVEMEQGVGEGVLFYGGRAANNQNVEDIISNIHTKADMEAFVGTAKDDKLLTVVNVSVTSAAPCIRVYPAVLALAKNFAGLAKFARVLGDESDETRELMSELNIIEVPTFIFYRGGEEVGRHVGSSRGDLIGQILQQQASAGMASPAGPAAAPRVRRKMVRRV